MKIKTNKKMRLDELIQYVWDNDIKNKTFESHFGIEVRFGGNQAVIMSHFLDRDDTFTVTVEEELTEETEINGATLVYYNELKREVMPFRYADVTSPTLEHIIQTRPDTVALAVFRGKQLIWTKESGIPESGVLEEDVK